MYAEYITYGKMNNETNKCVRWLSLSHKKSDNMSDNCDYMIRKVEFCTVQINHVKCKYLTK